MKKSVLKKSVFENILKRMPEDWDLDGYLEIHPQCKKNGILGGSLRIRFVRSMHSFNKNKCLSFLVEINIYLSKYLGTHSLCSISFETTERGDIYHIFGYCYAYGGNRKQYESFHPQYKGMEKSYTVQLDDVKCIKHGNVSITLRIPHKSFEEDIVRCIRSLDTMHVKSIHTMIANTYGYSPVVSLVNEWLEDLVILGLVDHIFKENVHTFIFSPNPRNSIVANRFSITDISEISNTLSWKLAVMESSIFYNNTIDYTIDNKEYNNGQYVEFTVHCYEELEENVESVESVDYKYIKAFLNYKEC